MLGRKEWGAALLTLSNARSDQLWTSMVELSYESHGQARKERGDQKLLERDRDDGFGEEERYNQGFRVWKIRDS